jgi:hypothetical protein
MSHSKSRVQTYKASGAILRGQAVKLTANDTVTKSAAATDKSVGIALCDAADGKLVEVALPGGGAYGLCQTTVAKGKLLVSHTDAGLKPVAAANDRLVAMAMDDGSAGDLIPVEVITGQATATES